MITPATIPDLYGDVTALGDYRYRLYTVAELPFEAMLGRRDGGPGMAVIDGWAVGYTGTKPARLNARRGGYTEEGRYDPNLVERHELDGVEYPTMRDAERAAYDAGLLAFMVYERDAARFGLPTGGEA